MKLYTHKEQEEGLPFPLYAEPRLSGRADEPSVRAATGSYTRFINPPCERMFSHSTWKTLQVADIG